jgi:5-methyltetrahydropteroyltriglutamate--homocysteine methyltransferase
MRRSIDRILTTHVGSLVRPPELRELLAEQEHWRPVDEDHLGRLIREAVEESVRHQAEAGLDVVNDGEQSKYSYNTYARRRIGGLEMVDMPELAGRRGSPIAAEAADFPEYFARREYGVAGAVALACTGPLTYQGHDALQRDIANLLAAAEKVDIVEPFMTAISPGVMKSTPNQFYADEDDYHHAIADALKEEYEAIVNAGILLQIDCPDLGIFSRTHLDVTLVDHRREVAHNIELLNHATRDIDPDAMRFHVCWGADEAPHHKDVELASIVDLLVRGRPAGMTIVGANGRHEHEWTVWDNVNLPEGKVVVPGVIDSTSNIIEHPELVAFRIMRYAKALGPENVVAGVDCGFSTFATDQSDRVDPRIAWAKLATLSEGAAIASAELF